MGLKTEDWVGIMGSISEILSHKRQQKQDYLNQPLVQAWNDETGQKEWIRRGDASGMAVDDPNKWQKEYESDLNILAQMYNIPEKQKEDYANYKVTDAGDLKLATGKIKADFEGESGGLEEVDQKVFQSVNRTDELITALQTDIVQNTTEFTRLLVSSGAYEEDSDYVQHLKNKAAEGEIDMNKNNLLLLNVAFQYIPTKNPKENKKRLKEAQERFDDYMKWKPQLQAKMRAWMKGQEKEELPAFDYNSLGK
tara:strand:- start:65 stop:820 length:756 start_codon:yes stop_codon:yes gene_type:complete